MVLYSENNESVEWINMCWRKVWSCMVLIIACDSGSVCAPTELKVYAVHRLGVCTRKGWKGGLRDCCSLSSTTSSSKHMYAPDAALAKAPIAGQLAHVTSHSSARASARISTVLTQALHLPGYMNRCPGYTPEHSTASSVPAPTTALPDHDLPACFVPVYCTCHPCHHVWPHISCCTTSIHHLVAQVPRLLKRLRILEFTLDHEAPYFSNMRRRTSRRDSDLNGVVDVRYTGGARMLLLLEVGSRHFKVKVRTF